MVLIFVILGVIVALVLLRLFFKGINNAKRKQPIDDLLQLRYYVEVSTIDQPTADRIKGAIEEYRSREDIDQAFLEMINKEFKEKFGYLTKYCND